MSVPESIRVTTPEGDISLKNDFVFALIGYQPDLPFLNATGITLEPETQRPRTNSQTLESERQGIYLAGVIVAALLLLYEHSLVKADDFSRLDPAFFTMNGVISLVFLGFVLTERLLK